MRSNLTEVRRIATRDSLKNGAIIGASVLGELAILGANCCGLSHRGIGTKVFWVTFGIAAGAGIGTLVDYAIKGRQTVYERPSASPSLQITPIVAPHKFGVGWGG